MNHGSPWNRWSRGARWSWINPQYRSRLPADFEQSVMTLKPTDRYHAKQGRSTARIVIDPAQTPAEQSLSIYLKRHYSLPLRSRLAAIVHPRGAHSPAAQEWAALRRVAALGIEVPDVVAVGETIGPGARLQSFLALADLVGCEPLNEAMETLSSSLDSEAFRRAGQRIIAELARITATLHASNMFHKDLYLCHFFLDLSTIEDDSRQPRIVLIDLHRAREHRLFADWWRSKDLAQLRFSADDVPAIHEADAFRFWYLYRLLLGLRHPAWHLRLIGLRTWRYRSHNRKRSKGAVLRPRQTFRIWPRSHIASQTPPVRMADTEARG